MAFHSFERNTCEGRDRKDQAQNERQSNDTVYHSFLLNTHLVSFLSSFFTSPKTYLLIRSSISVGVVVSVIIPAGLRISPPPPGSILTNLSPMRPEVLISAEASS